MEARVFQQPTITCARVHLVGLVPGARGERISVTVLLVTTEARVSATMMATVVSVPVGSRATIVKKRSDTMSNYL